MAITKKFPREFMLELLDDGEGNVISDEIYDTGRWSVHHALTFKHEDKVYLAHYSVGATEYQDEAPWDHEKEVECTEMRAVQKTVTVWEPA